MYSRNKSQGETTHILRFADDIFLLTDETKELEQVRNRTELYETVKWRLKKENKIKCVVEMDKNIRWI